MRLVVFHPASFTLGGIIGEDATRPPVEEVEMTPISLSKTEGWFKFKDAYVVLRFSKKRDNVEVYVIEGDTITGRHMFPGGLVICTASIVVKEVDICSQLSEVVKNYQDLLTQYELVERAKATRILNDQLVPSMPKEFNVLVHALTRKVLESRIVKTFYIRTGSGEALLGIYCYEGGYYAKCEESITNELTRIASDSNLLDIRLVPTLVGTVVENIKVRTKTQFSPLKKCLLFKNKVFCWDPFLDTKDIEKALVDPSPDLIVMHRIPWELKPEILKNARPGLLKYVPPQSQEDIVELFKALAPKSFKAFLDWVRKPGEDEKDAYPRVALLLEIIGYTLYPHDYPLHKAILLVGEGSNGKTTYLKLIERILTMENIASVSLTELDPDKHRFAAADLYGKLANLASEPGRGAFDPNRFKMATGEDPMPFERKHRDRFLGHNYAKMIFSANELPQVKEDTYAFWRRWIVIEFPNQFPLDPGFFERTFTPDEIEVIILLSLHAFRLVLERRGFSESGVEDVREEWLSRSNPVYKVVRRMLNDGVIEFAADGFIVKKDLYELYKRYVQLMRDEGYEVDVLDQKDFTRYLTRYFPVRTGDKRVEGRKKHVYLGIRIKNYEKARELVGVLETPQGLV
ncbi:MAG: phage/plasmid primase, P4 family [Thermofilaceae archaeon]